MRKVNKSPYKGGVGVVEYMMRRNCWRELTEAEATALWQECKAQLVKMRLRSTVRACEQSDDGGLDTLERGDVLDALALLFTNMRWPLNMDGEEGFNKFAEVMGPELRKRGYKVEDDANTEETAA
jgi:hypothetical protein